MNSDIRIHVGLPRHMKYKRLKRAIGESPMEYLVCMWGYIAQYQPSGELIGWTGEEIEDIACWDGEPGLLFNSLLSVGFIDEIENGYYPHDWNDHQTWVIGSPARSEKAKNASNARWNKNNSSDNTGSYTKPMQEQCYKDATSIAKSNPPSPSPSPSLKDKEQQQSTNAGEQVLLLLPEKKARLKELFPHIDLDVALEKFINRCRSKPCLLDPYEATLKWLQTEFKPVKSVARASPDAQKSKALLREEANIEATQEALRLVKEMRHGQGRETAESAVGIIGYSGRGVHGETAAAVSAGVG